MSSMQSNFLQRCCSIKHIKAVHQNISSFLCFICNKKFRTGYRLYVHQLSHKGLKPFVCDICKKRFIEKGTLKSHLISHQKEKEFQCELCSYKANSDSHLREHYKYKHKQYSYYKCKQCEMRFRYKGEI